MGFINDDIMPFDFFEVTKAYSNTLKRGENNVKLAWSNTFLKNILSFLLSGDQLNNSTTRHPFFELIFPVAESDFWRDDYMRPFDFLKLLDEGYNRNGLNRLAQSHVISQNAVYSAFIERNHPVETNKLIVFELPSFETGRLFVEPGESFLLMLFLLDHMQHF